MRRVCPDIVEVVRHTLRDCGGSRCVYNVYAITQYENNWEEAQNVKLTEIRYAAVPSNGLVLQYYSSQSYCKPS
jgi:hypothetical protein